MSNEPIKTAEAEYKVALDKAYKEAGHNAYFGNGFKAGFDYASQQTAELQREVEELKGVLTKFINSTYTGCSKYELDCMRIEAEQALKDK